MSGLMTTTARGRQWSVVTADGTAMSEATLCAKHYSDPELRAYAENVASGADDRPARLEWHDSSGNDVACCVECSDRPGTSDFERRMELITLRQSDDPVKTDLEVTCGRCTGVICDAQHDDTLDVLIRTAEHHLNQCEPFECKHCGRTIYPIGDGTWVCPEAGTDVENGDGIWRETCENNDQERSAPHEPKIGV